MMPIRSICCFESGLAFRVDGNANRTNRTYSAFLPKQEGLKTTLSNIKHIERIDLTQLE